MKITTMPMYPKLSKYLRFYCLLTCLLLCSIAPLAQAATSTVVYPLTVRTVDVRTSLDASEVQLVPANSSVLEVKPEPSLAAAASVQEHAYRKKILATAFAVSRLGQVQDIEDIAHGFPRELLLRLEKTDLFLTRNSPSLLAFTMQSETPSINLVKQVAAEFDSQFIIAGEIRNAGVQIDKKYLGLWETRTRHMEIEIAIYDGISGAMLSRHNLHTQAADQANVGRDRPFGSAAFYATSYGQAIDTILNHASVLVEHDLQQLPILARILKAGKGQIVIDVGATSAVALGDSATVLVGNNELPTLGLRSHQPLLVAYGLPQTNVGKAAVIQVQNNFSIAELASDVKEGEVKAGDFVRFGGPASK
ncbi:flagella assembly protein FlgT middle domain-containing protein [Undibacterium sp. Ren11W]|uniref:flagella assembly protein FlgT middle domain-containing protein n=1 Tax=Undibacterium sp. Ren11W TaxID=3413045 RepID=UPI003BF303DA